MIDGTKMTAPLTYADRLSKDNKKYRREFEDASKKYKDNLLKTKEYLKNKEFFKAKASLTLSRHSLNHCIRVINNMESDAFAVATSWLTPIYKEMTTALYTSILAVSAYLVFSRNDHGKFLNSQLTPQERAENAKTVRNIALASSIVIQKLKLVTTMIKNPGKDLKTTLNVTRTKLIVELKKMSKELDKLDKKIDKKKNKEK